MNKSLYVLTSILLGQRITEQDLSALAGAVGYETKPLQEMTLEGQAAECAFAALYELISDSAMGQRIVAANPEVV